MEKLQQELEELTQEAIAIAAISTIATAIAVTSTFSVEFHMFFIISHCRDTLGAVVQVVKNSGNIEAV